jgi:catechol 2,3-dioxygenase-like lactoylglutathione lyase family enzyme
MSRVQLALNVRDVDAAVEFYSQLFDTEPAKRRPGYANFAIANPPLKLVLLENPSVEHSQATGSLNHLGIEVESVQEVATAGDRLRQAGLTVESEGEVTCCYALQEKVWVRGSDEADWEIYTVLDDSATFGKQEIQSELVCCG